MEKLVYLLWSDKPIDELRATLLGETAPRLLERGACGLKLNVADQSEALAGRTVVPPRPGGVAGSVSVWLDCLDDRAPLEESLREASSRLAGYLPLRSLPSGGLPAAALNAAHV